MKDEIKEKIDDIFWEVKKHPMDSDYLVKKEEMELLLDYITNLQEEIERQSKAQVILDNQIAEMYDYKTRNEKAIEHIKQNIKNDTFTEWYDGDFEELLNILQGGDK